ncbi:MAG TPA: bifunctional diaminohydroxyphosphoribosylaminopyrimidine deaminase/5-amino-6-(5-phosphoribosylamino)uracil reductase RibD [Chloroflexota bacterium]|nr:bifunctional diaminohydroxyphosphoribosylaminopyrimidine deaminase/5-amino-6-(5-phosphoribosylamino)uracil reductase RibD [Chloroflexota bacterium]
MAEALELAARARGRTSPNPMVGAVVVRDGRVVGRGYHHRAGEPHAEVLALREAGELARGATLCVTLEPCSHMGRTPPCAPAVVEAGIAEVFAAIEDPNPLVAGSGLRFLQDHGVAVHTGLLSAEALDLNEAFVKRITTGLPFVEIKVAMTLDGKTATSSGRSRWISGETSRRWVHQRRDHADAVLVGANTVRLDNPQLTVRPAPTDGRQPLRCVVTASGNLPAEANLFTDGAAETVVFCSEDRVPKQLTHATFVMPNEVQHPRFAGDRTDSSLDAQNDKMNVDLSAVLRHLAERGVNDVLVEGGAQLNAALLRAGLVDRVSAFVAPKLFGGCAPGGFGELGVLDPSQAIGLEDLSVEQVGEDWLFRGRPAACSQA